MITRRSTLALLVAAGAAPALASCGPNAASEEEDAPLRVYWWGGELRDSMTREALDLYIEKNPGTEIAPEYSEWTGYWDKLATQTAGGDSHDVLQMDESYIDSYGTRGALLDLSTVAEQLDLSAMDDAVLDTGRLADGTLVGAPLGIGIYSVGVNPVLLEQAGAEMPDDTSWTWEEFAALATQISDRAASAGEDVVGFDGFGMNAAELHAWTRQSGQQLFPREDEEPVTKETIVGFLEYSLGLVGSGAVPSPSAQVEDGAAGVEQGHFGTNKSAFHLQFHTQVQTFQAASGSPLRLLRLPALTPGDHQMVNKASMYWSISATTPSPEASASLVDFLLRDREAAKILKIERGVTAFPELQDEIATELDENEMVSLDFARTMQAEVVRPPLVTPASAVGFGDEFSRLAQESLFGSRPPAEVADEILDILGTMQPST